MTPYDLAKRWVRLPPRLKAALPKEQHAVALYLAQKAIIEPKLFSQKDRDTLSATCDRAEGLVRSRELGRVTHWITDRNGRRYFAYSHAEAIYIRDTVGGTIEVA